MKRSRSTSRSWGSASTRTCATVTIAGYIWSLGRDNGGYRWLTVQHPEQPSFQLGLFTPGPPVLDAATAQTLRAVVAKGAMPPLVLVVDDCRAAHDRMRARGVEFTQEPVDRYGTVDAGFRDPSGNGWKMIEARR